MNICDSQPSALLRFIFLFSLLLLLLISRLLLPLQLGSVLLLDVLQSLEVLLGQGEHLRRQFLALEVEARQCLLAVVLLSALVNHLSQLLRQLLALRPHRLKSRQEGAQQVLDCFESHSFLFHIFLVRLFVLFVVGVPFFLEDGLVPEEGLHDGPQLSEFFFEVEEDCPVLLDLLVVWAVVDLRLGLVRVVALGVHGGHRLRNSVSSGRNRRLQSSVERRGSGVKLLSEFLLAFLHFLGQRLLFLFFLHFMYLKQFEWALNSPIKE